MLSDAFLRRLDTLALRMRHPASGGSGGLRRSKALGSSVEFSDFREYALGDDVRLYVNDEHKIGFEKMVQPENAVFPALTE